MLLLLVTTYLLPGFFATQALFPKWGAFSAKSDLLLRLPIWILMSVALNLPFALIAATPAIGFLKLGPVLAYQLGISSVFAYFAWRRKGLWPLSFLGRRVAPVPRGFEAVGRSPRAVALSWIAKEVIEGIKAGRDMSDEMGILEEALG